MADDDDDGAAARDRGPWHDGDIRAGHLRARLRTRLLPHHAAAALDRGHGYHPVVGCVRRGEFRLGDLGLSVDN